MFDPYGPLPSAVYWRRRAVALLAVLLLIAAAAWGLSTLIGGSSKSGSADRPPAGAQATAGSAPSAEAQARPSTPPPTCPDKAVRVSTEVPRTKLPAGKPVVFRLVVTNVGDEPCRRDTGATLRQLIVLREGGKRVWSSDDCHAHTTNEKPLLRPGKSVENKVTWLARTSEPGCPIKRETVGPGRYRVVAKLGKLVSEPVNFRLT